MYDYQGRSYLHIPQDVGINLRSSDVPDKCYLPKKQIHVWSGHTKASGTEGFLLCQLWSQTLTQCKQKLTVSSRVLSVQGVSAIRLFPRSAHLLLSCSMDCKIKVGEFIRLYRVLLAF